MGGGSPASLVSGEPLVTEMPVMRVLLASLLCLVGLAAPCLAQGPAKVPAVFAAYATELAEPWNQVIHGALQDAEKMGRITYAWQDKLGTAEAMAAGLNSALVRRPDVVVAGKSDLQVHRAINAYKQGVKDANPAARVKVAFTGSWYDPPRAKQVALEQIAAGADVIWAEREGAIAAAREKGVLAFGNLVDQSAEGADTVLTGPVWSMTPLIDHVTKLSAAGMVRAENYIDFSSLARGGAVLAPWHGWNDKLPPDVLELVRQKQNAIKTGELVVAPNADRPTTD